MIDLNTLVPFSAYMLTPNRMIREVRVVKKEEETYGIYFELSTGRRFVHPGQLFPSRRSAALHVEAWIKRREAVLKAELAKLKITKMDIQRILKEESPS